MLNILLEVIEGSLHGIKTFLMIQGLILLAVIVYLASWPNRIICLLCLALLTVSFHRFMRWLTIRNKDKRNPDWVIKYKLDHNIVFTLPKQFYIFMSILSLVVFVLASYFTWFVDEPPKGTYEECAIVLDAENPQTFEVLLRALPNCVTLPVVHLTVAIDTLEQYGDNIETATEEQVTEIERITDELEYASSRVQLYFVVSVILWLLYGLLNKPARIKNHVKE